MSKLIGVSDRVVGYYEANVRFPNKPETLREISKVFNVSVDYLLGIDGTLDQSSVVQFDNTGWGQAQEILKGIQKIFASEEVLEEDKDEVFRLITEMYFEAKQPATRQQEL